MSSRNPASKTATLKTAPRKNAAPNGAAADAATPDAAASPEPRARRGRGAATSSEPHVRWGAGAKEAPSGSHVAPAARAIPVKKTRARRGAGPSAKEIEAVQPETLAAPPSKVIRAPPPPPRCVRGAVRGRKAFG